MFFFSSNISLCPVLGGTLAMPTSKKKSLNFSYTGRSFKSKIDVVQIWTNVTKMKINNKPIPFAVFITFFHIIKFQLCIKPVHLQP